MAKAGPNVLKLSNRDLELLRGLFECRIMSMAHAASLFFNGKSEAAKKRLQKLKRAGLVGERPRRSFEPSLLVLSRKGLQLLQGRGVLAQYPAFSLSALERRANVSQLTIRHELEVMDVKAAFHVAASKIHGLAIETFSTWPLLNEFRACRAGTYQAEIPVKPDGFIRIDEPTTESEGREFCLFLEVDRSTETQEKLLEKADCYADYYKSGGFAIRNGGPREDYKRFPFRVLFVFKTAERRNNTAERLLENSRIIPGQICLSTMAEVIQNPLGAIWISAHDYRDALIGTRFERLGMAREWRHRRNAERDVHVESSIRKFSILA